MRAFCDFVYQRSEILVGIPTLKIEKRLGRFCKHKRVALHRKGITSAVIDVAKCVAATVKVKICVIHNGRPLCIDGDVTHPAFAYLGDFV